MARRVFYSFHYQPDNWRAAMVRNIGSIEGNLRDPHEFMRTEPRR